MPLPTGRIWRKTCPRKSEYHEESDSDARLFDFHVFSTQAYASHGCFAIGSRRGSGRRGWARACLTMTDHAPPCPATPCHAASLWPRPTMSRHALPCLAVSHLAPEPGLGGAWRGWAGQGKARLGHALPCPAMPRRAPPCPGCRAWRGVARLGWARRGSVGPGLARLGGAWLGSAGPGRAIRCARLTRLISPP